MTESISWEKASDIAEDQKETYQFITTDSKGAEVAVPFIEPLYATDITVAIVDKNYNVALMPLHAKADTLPAEFSWAKEPFNQAQIEWDKIENSDAKPLQDNFRQRGGIFALTVGEADPTRLENAINKSTGEKLKNLLFEKDTPKTGENWTSGSLSRGYTSKKIDYIMTLSATSRSSTNMIHELTHAGDNGCSQSDFFTKCYTRDIFRGSKMAEDTYNDLFSLIRSGAYTQAKAQSELICRLSERRHEDPKQFKEECPYLDAFYSKVFYPALRAQTAATKKNEKIGNQEALTYLQDTSLLSDKVQPFSDGEKNLINRLRQQYLSEPNLKKQLEIRSSLIALIDGSNSSKSMLQTMDEFKTKMDSLATQTILDHVEEIAPPQRPTTNHDLLRNSSNEGQPMDNHNAIDIRDAYKDKKPLEQIKSEKPSTHESEREKRQREIMEQMMGVKKGFSL